MRLVASQRVIVNNDCVYADVSDILLLQGQKRRAIEEESSSSLSSSPTSAADTSFSLNTRYGLNAWRRWATSEASPSSQSKGKERKQGVNDLLTNLNYFIQFDL